MTGNNELRLSIQTLSEAVQEYIDKRIPHHPQNVNGIEWDSQNDVLRVYLTTRPPIE